MHGPGTVDAYLGRIYVPDLDTVIMGRFAGVHLVAGGQPHAAILGRSFLQHFTMMYDGRTGEVSINND